MCIRDRFGSVAASNFDLSLIRFPNRYASAAFLSISATLTDSRYALFWAGKLSLAAVTILRYTKTKFSSGAFGIPWTTLASSSLASFWASLKAFKEATAPIESTDNFLKFFACSSVKELPDFIASTKGW